MDTSLGRAGVCGWSGDFHVLVEALFNPSSIGELSCLWQRFGSGALSRFRCLVRLRIGGRGIVNGVIFDFSFFIEMAAWQ
jgi:hypothetical protein